MSSRSLLLVTAAIAFCAALPLHATTYYVATTGNDGNPCSATAPCRTISHAYTLAVAGDVVQVASGTYTETVTLNRSGNATAGKITIQGFPVGGACPQSSDPDPNSRGLRPSPSVTVTTFNVTTANYVAVSCFATTGKGMDIAYGRTDIDFTDAYVSNNVLVEMHSDLATRNSWPQRINVLRSYAKGGWIGAVIGCQSCTFQDNELDTPVGSAGADGDYTHFFGQNVNIVHNYLHGADAQVCLPNCHIDCWQTFNNNNTDTWWNNVTIDRNVCFNSHEGLMASNASGDSTCCDNLKLTNNLIAYGPNDSHPWCMVAYGTQHMTLLNNTCIGGGMQLEYMNGPAGTLAAQDNIFYGMGGTPYGVQSPNTLGTHDHNLLYQSGFTYSSTAWPNDVLNLDPKFVGGNTSANNYQLQSGSSAVDRGSAVGVSIDLAGISRPQGSAPDIGAYEFSSGVASTPPPAPLSLTALIQ